MSRIGRIASRLIQERATRRVARTLYHGTTLDNEASIRSLGLVGGVGSFVEDAYGEYLEAGEELPDLVFLADKQGLGKAVSAMVHHIGDKLGKNFHDVTDNDILNYGLLVIVYDGENRVEQRPKDDQNYDGQYPSHVEPGDYFTDYSRGGKFVKGRQLLRLLERYGQWPRTYGDSTSGRMNKMRGELIAVGLRTNPGKTKQEVMGWIQGLSDRKVEQLFSQYIRRD